MNAFISILALLAGSQAQVVQYAHPYAGAYAAGYPYGVAHPVVAQAPTVTVKAAPVVAAPVAIAPPAAPSSQFQAQDEFGNLQYGYANINSQKHEVGNTYGGVSGSYSYIDANGVIQTTNYISDALGFRVQATNLPVHHVEADAAVPVAEAAPVVVAAAPAVAAPAVVATKAVEGHAMVPQVPYSYLPYATAYGYQAAPVAAVQASPVAAVHAAPVAAVHAAPVAVPTAHVAVHSAPV